MRIYAATPPPIAMRRHSRCAPRGSQVTRQQAAPNAHVLFRRHARHFSAGLCAIFDAIEAADVITLLIAD